MNSGPSDDSCNVSPLITELPLSRSRALVIVGLSGPCVKRPSLLTSGLAREASNPSAKYLPVLAVAVASVE